MAAVIHPARRSVNQGLAAASLAAALAVVARVLHWKGGDLPAQLYRIGLFRQKGFALWDDQWYGGHHTIGYSLLLPPLGAILGVAVLGGASAVIATWAFHRLVRTLPAGRYASLWFAAGTVTNLAVGRLAFALGLAVGLCALAAFAAGRPVLTGLLALLTAAASPVAGAFLVLAGGAIALSNWRRGPAAMLPGVAVAAAAAAPVLVFAVAFPEGGRFPFTTGAFVTVMVVAVLAASYWRSGPIAAGGVVYGLATLGVFVVATPLGGNISRLGMVAAAPLLICAPFPPHRLVRAGLLIALLWWQWSPALDAMTTGGRDPSALANYYDPLISFLRTQPGGPLRIEVPVTRHHWEVVYLAPQVGLARGWERQLDIAHNGLFYARNLDADTYLSWLGANAVSYVALPDVPLDSSAVAEAALLRAGVPDLRVAWSSAHWTVWQVQGADSLVSGPATLEKLDADSFVLQVSAPGDVTVRVRYTSHWEITQGAACVGPSTDGDGWTLVRAVAPGRVKVDTTLSRTLLPGARRPEPCEVRGA